jgi:hypothetical protein
LITVAQDKPYLTKVKDAYKRKYTKELVKRIEGDTSGNYLKLLVAVAKSDK